MPNRLELPKDLQSLIEKREQADRRATGETAVEGAAEPPRDSEQSSSELRSGADRRREE